MKKWLLFALAGLALLAVACGGGGEATPGGTPQTGRPPGWKQVKTDYGVTDTEIRVGHRNILSGPLAVFAAGAPFLEAYVRKVNAEGGICGRNLRLIVEDHQGNPARALEVSQKLVDRDQVVATIGDVGTSAVAATLDYMNQAKVPQLFATLGVERLLDPQKYPYTITFVPTFASDFRIMARLINERFPNATVAILYQNDAAGQDGLAGFKQEFRGRIVAEQSYESTATELTSQLANLKAANPDLLVSISLSITFTQQVFRYMAGTNWQTKVFMAYPNTPSGLASAVGGGNAEAGYRQIAGAVLNVYVMEAALHRNTPEWRELEQITQQYGAPPVQPATIYMASAAQLSVEALKRACDQGDMTRDGVLRAAQTIRDFHPFSLWPGILVTVAQGDPYTIETMVPVEVQADGSLRPLSDRPISGEARR